MVIKGEDIGLLISKPEIGVENQLEDLNKLIKKYAYCSSLYFIQLKIKSANNHVDFEEKLKLAAAHVPDREHLYHLINSTKETPKPTQKPVEDTIAPFEAEAAKELLANSTVQTPILKEITTIESPDNIEIGVDFESTYEQSKSEEEKIEQEASKPKLETPIGEEIHIKLETSHLEDLTEVDAQEKAEKTIEAVIESTLNEEIMSHAIAVAFENDPETAISENTEVNLPIETESSIAEKERASVPSTEGMSFIEWLNFKKQKGEKALRQDADKKIESNGEKEKSTINDLLDKFISEEPRISAPSKDFYSPSANARKSIEESSGIVSETLAKIHVMQGNYKKAISAYKQLILLYPEKKVFFASQIEKIIEKQSL